MILPGDCREVLRSLPDNSVHCCVTSPPYYGLRDYGVDGQLGLEQTPDEYVAEMVSVFREVRRVLRADGTCWLNLGDSYANTGGHTAQGESSARKNRANVSAENAPKGYAGGNGVKIKDLLMIPAQVALALRADGWYLRKDIIWAKPNPMPESVVDRPTSSHEHVFLLAKSPSYFFDKEAVREPYAPASAARYKYAFKDDVGSATNNKSPALGAGKIEQNPGGRNLRDVWTITTKSFKGAHFATMPVDLAEICIRAGTSAHGVCGGCGAPYERVVEKGDPDLEHQRACGAAADGSYDGQSTKDYASAGAQDASDTKRRILAGMVAKTTTGWKPTCDCGHDYVLPATVLDPFGGAGTTGLAASNLGRDAILIELNPEYVTIAETRLGIAPAWFPPPAAEPDEMAAFFPAEVPEELAQFF